MKFILLSLFLTLKLSAQAGSLSLNQSIAGELLTEVLVGDKEGAHTVKIKILQDVYNLVSGDLVIPKGSIASGTTTKINETSNTMDLKIDKVTVGSKIFNIPFTIKSGDLGSGLKGEVRDAKGKLIGGSYVSELSASAIDLVDPSSDSDNVDPKLRGEVISCWMRPDFSRPSSSKVFYVPAGVKLVLTTT